MNPSNISRLQKSTFRAYQTERDAARSRMDKKELTNDEFVRLLLDVYRHHLDGCKNTDG